MFGLGATELGIILLIVIIFFGVGKVGTIGKAVGDIIHDLRNAVKDDDVEDIKKGA
jgi:TatA/E family protein of Tat protein translocase